MSDALARLPMPIDHRAARRTAIATRGHLTRIKNLIAAGVCPVPGCKRPGLGDQVDAHIAMCHPNIHTRKDQP